MGGRVRAADEPSRLARWALEENRRTVLAMLAASAVGITMTAALRSLEQTGVLRIAVASVLSGWAAFSLTHYVLCWAAYRGSAGADLRARLLADPSQVPRQRRLARAVLGSSSHSFALNASGMSLLGVILLVLYPDLRRDVLLLLVGVALVVTSWLDMAMAYAVQYARSDLTEGGLAWPGESEQHFADYEYFSCGVQSTLGTTDVTVVTTAMRDAVRRHGLIAFTFNSVIVALLVSLVFTLG